MNSQKPQALILTTSFPLYEGIAVGVHVIEQARHLVKLGCPVDVLAPHHQGAAHEELIDGIQVHRFRYMWPLSWQNLCYGAGMPTNLKNSWWARLQLPFLFLAFLLNALPLARRCDVIQANWSLAGMVGIILGRIFRKPVVLVMYGAEVFVLKDNPILKFVIRNADHVMAISQYTLDKTLEVATPPEHSLIAPGVDVTRFYPQHDPAIEQKLTAQGIDFSQPLVFALGKFIERKGFPYLLEAMAMLQTEQPVQLMIGGRGPLKPQLQQQARDLGISERVFFLDYIPDETLPVYYTMADLFVSPSIVDSRGDTEGLGVVLMEAQACKTPCVASGIGGILDILKDGVGGFLVEPANAAALAERMQQLIADPALRQQMGETGRQFVEQECAWTVKAEQILQVYQTLLERQK